MFTSIFYPDTGNPGTNTMSAMLGWVGTSGQQTAWSTARGTSGNTVASSSGSSTLLLNQVGSSTNNFYSLTRFGMTFKTDSLSSIANITGAKISLYVDVNNMLAVNGFKVNVTSFTPASNNAFVNADGNVANYGSTRFVDTDITPGIGAYVDWVFNAAGIAAINKTGISKFALRLACDIDNTAPVGGGTANANNFINGRMAADGTYPVKLIVTYSKNILCGEI